MANELNEFGQILIQETRDKTITRFEKMVDGSLKSISAKAVQEKFNGFSAEQLEVVEWLIPQIVDSSLHNLLFMIEEHPELEVIYKGVNVNEESDGLAGELYTEDGWIEQFSSIK